MSRLWILVSLLALLIAMPARAEAPFKYESTFGNLPKNVRPVAYQIDLDLVPDSARLSSADGAQTLDFKGRVDIAVEVLEATETFTFNAVDLDLESVSVDGANATLVAQDKEKMATYRAAQKLAPGRHNIVIGYTGKITPKPEGLYYVNYSTPQGQRRILVTQFEAVDARRMLPSWDEPVFKATFALSAVMPEGFVPISNMPIAHEGPAGAGKKKIVFKPSPKMSTYLLVLVAGQFDLPLRQTIAGVDVGVFAPEGRVQQGRYALDVMAKVLPYFNDYFGVKYPLPKLDLIAIPDFAAGAMENWGGITYVDNRLLFDPAASSQRTREDIFEVVAHETAHQWSGNLVTMAWWDNLWLNEGFATWMQKKVTDQINPTWKTWLRAHESKERAMAKDARSTARPIQRQILDDRDAGSAFDNITYDKGGALIRMIEAYVGEAQFRNGMRAYMKAHAYSSTTTADLWAALGKASGNKPVAAVATSFTEYPGIPLIGVTTSCVKGNAVVTLRQDRFVINSPYAEKRIWQVPVTVGQVGNAAPAQTVLVDDKPVSINLAGCAAPVKANFGNVGYYRVQYDTAGLKALSDRFGQLAAADRVNLLSDSWALVLAERAEPATYLDLTKLLAGEPELVVWKNVIEALRAIDNLQRGAAGRDAFRAYARGLLQPVLNRLGWDPKADEGPEAPQLRTLVIMTLGRLGDTGVIAEAKRRFAFFLKDPATLHKELREPVATVVGYHADRTAYEELRRRASQALGLEEKLLFYYALAGAGDPALIDETVKIARDDEKLPKGRVIMFLSKAATESDNPDRVWEVVFPQAQDIMNRLTSGHKERLLPLVATASATPSIAFQLKWAKPSRSRPSARYEADKAVEDIEFKADIRERLLPKVDVWIKSNSGS